MPNRNTESRRVSSAGTVGGARLAPAVHQPLPPGGGDGNVPTTPGSHSLPGGRGPEVQSSIAPQEFAADVSSVSGTKKFVSPNGMVDVPEGLDARSDKWGNIVFHIKSREVVVRLVGELLFRVSRGKGSVVYLDNGRMASLLGLSGRLDVYSSSWVRGVLAQLGFEEVRKGKRNKATVISMDKPVMKEIKAAKSIDEVIMTVKKYLGE